jgi:hypothetical protein
MMRTAISPRFAIRIRGLATRLALAVESSGRSVPAMTR